MILKFLQKSRLKMAQDLEGSETQWKFSPSLFADYSLVLPVIKKFARGRLLDVGCGTMPFRPYIEKQLECYDGFDIERRSEQTTFLGDAQEMKDIPDASYDTIVSFSSLEHMPQPWKAFAEMRRVCKPGAIIILVVPHFTRLHEEPHDYFRFTGYGLRSLAENLGLEVIDIQPVGGLFTFLAHQVSTLLVCSFWSIPILKWVAFWLNYGLVVRPSIFLDRVLGTEKKYPNNVLGIFRCPDTDA